MTGVRPVVRGFRLMGWIRWRFILPGVAVLLVVAVVLLRSGASAVSASHGTRLLVFGTGGYGLALTNSHGRVLRILSSARGGTWGLWSPNDARIAWTDPLGVHVERANGRGVRLLVKTVASCNCGPLDFIWSPNSRSLIVGSAGKRGNQLQLVPIDGAKRRIIEREAPGVHLAPDFWTPGGTLVYSAQGNGPNYYGAVTSELTLATGRIRFLWTIPNALPPNDNTEPIISPNLRYWANTREIDQYHQQLRILDKATGQGHVVKGVYPTNLIAWSPDSRSLAVIESGWHVVTVAPGGTLQHQIGNGNVSVWGRDGELFILNGPHNETNQIWMSRNGAPERLLFRLPKNDQVISLDAN